MKLDYKEFEGMFGKWAPKFKDFIEGEEMYQIYEKLKSENEVIVPSSDQTFNCFGLTDPAEVKVIFYLMDPYPRRYKNKANQACGVAMDCRNSPDDKIQPSLEIFYDAVSKDVGRRVEYSKSLDYLLTQGVMFLNTDLTCKLNKTSSHEGLWEPFQKYFLEEVMRSHTGMIYVLCGKASLRMEKYINPLGNYIFKLEHPAAAAHSHTDWQHKEIFKQINTILKQNNNDYIEWDKREFDDCPF